MARDEMGTILLIGGLGFIAYEWWTGGLTNFLSSFTTTTPTTTNTTSSTVLANGGSTSQVDPLGTVETTAAGIAAQAQASLAYIVPSPSIGNVISLTPANYTSFTTSDMGIVYLRNDVAQAVQANLTAQLQRANAAYASQGLSLPVTDVQNISNVTIAKIQTIMSDNGLSGVFPINGGYGVNGLGKIAHYSPYATPTNYQAQVTGWELVSKSN